MGYAASRSFVESAGYPWWNGHGGIPVERPLAAMKAILQRSYGNADVLEVADVPEPVVGDGQVLVRVKAASLNAADVEYLSGRSIVRLAGLRRPPHQIPGSDVAGIVEAIGPNVTGLVEGEEVFGDLFGHGFGAFAEFVAAPAASMAPKPPDLAFEQAATLPQAAALAWQGLHDGRTTKAGSSVLINGAGGGVGSFAIQLAVAMGAEVTAVDRADKRAFVESLGASHFIDFEAEDYTRCGARFDTVIDVQARRSVRSVRRALTPTGRYGVVGGRFPRIADAILLGQVASRTSSQSIGIVAWRANDPEINAALLEAIRSGEVRPAIERIYPLADTADAFRRLTAGELRGKAVIAIG